MADMIAGVGTLIAAFAGIGTLLWGVRTYSDTKTRSGREPFLKEQFSLCFEASNLAARLATENDPDKWDDARRDFWRLFYGPLCIVENREVALAMVAVGNLIPKPDRPRPDQVPIAAETYRDASIQLAHKIRKLIQDAWGVDLGPLRPDTI
jgi:hypothetical protein